MVDLSQTRIWDVHAHPFLDHGQITTDDFIRLTSFCNPNAEKYFADGGMDLTPDIRAEIDTWIQNTTWYKLLIRELAAFFGCERSVDGVVAARNAAVAGGYRAYVGQLYGDAGIDGIVFDDGYPLPQVPMDKVREQI